MRIRGRCCTNVELYKFHHKLNEYMKETWIQRQGVSERRMGHQRLRIRKDRGGGAGS